MYNNNFHLFQIICWLCVSCPISVSICVNVNVYSQNYGFHVLMLILAFLILVLIFKYLLDSHSFGKHVWPFFLSRKLYLQCQIVCTMHLLLILNPIYRQWRWSHVLITGSVYLFIEGVLIEYLCLQIHFPSSVSFQIPTSYILTLAKDDFLISEKLLIILIGLLTPKSFL